MFEKIGRLAEAAANNVSVSRRGFLSRLGQGALTAIGVLGGTFLLSQGSQAGGSGLYCCKYRCGSPYRPQGFFEYRCYSGGCPRSIPGGGLNCYLASKRSVTTCADCR
jgi:hypothetical protein